MYSTHNEKDRHTHLPHPLDGETLGGARHVGDVVGEAVHAVQPHDGHRLEQTHGRHGNGVHVHVQELHHEHTGLATPNSKSFNRELHHIHTCLGMPNSKSFIRNSTTYTPAWERKIVNHLIENSTTYTPAWERQIANHLIENSTTYTPVWGCQIANHLSGTPPRTHLPGNAK